MLELLSGPLGLVLAAAVIWWGVTFNTRLRERYGCTAFTFWGVTGGVVGTFCWVLLLDNPLCWQSAIVGVLALAITLALFFSNRAKSGSTFAAVTMTVWQLFVGLVVFLIFSTLDIGKKKKEK